eukprot:CAMPEP_0181139826 /NCGR_PEP_ID=MMETSP1071-20121207/34986_1 /TAXON_ID=35127 /ORGANISM="Thalassiosira sp., Strain NH16" /LENGTH=91 /DNA_ID=CAMNT_0023226753 /DNA_START=690 /DNA_END=965 /DNA_ORIENTATION=+
MIVITPSLYQTCEADGACVMGVAEAIPIGISPRDIGTALLGPVAAAAAAAAIGRRGVVVVNVPLDAMAGFNIVAGRVPHDGLGGGGGFAAG